jgi:DNA-binding MarR family transcriptional regulator
MNTNAVEHLVRSLYRLGMVQRELARHALAELGSQGFLALGVIRVQGPVRVSDVAQTLNVALSVASRQVAALERAGYVAREADPEDGRAHRVSVTEAGRRVLEESHRRMVSAFSRALADWGDDEVVALSESLERLREDVHHDVASDGVKGTSE